MLAAEPFINQILSRYPKALRSRLRQDMLELVKRDRSFWISQVQLTAAKYHCSCAIFTRFRADLDKIILSTETNDPH